MGGPGGDTGRSGFSVRPMPRLPLARPGSFTDQNGTSVVFSEADLVASAAAYDPAKHEAPVVIGHPKDTAPAYGWVQALEFGEGGLVATAHNTVAEFAELVSGPFKKRSARFYTPTSPRNPVPGVYYLRDVGLLGAQPPAIKGLADVSFAEEESDVVEVAFAEDAPTAEPPSPPSPLAQEGEGGQEFDPDDTPTQVDPMPTAEEIAAREAALAEREAKLAAKEAELTKAEHVAFAESLKEKLHPSQKDTVVSLLCHLDPGHPTEVEFAEGETPLERFKGLLNGLPKLVEFGEVAKPSDTVDFAENPIALAEAARTYQAEQAAKGITIGAAEAVAKVAKK